MIFITRRSGCSVERCGVVVAADLQSAATEYKDFIIQTTTISEELHPGVLGNNTLSAFKSSYISSFQLVGLSCSAKLYYDFFVSKFFLNGLTFGVVLGASV